MLKFRVRNQRWSVVWITDGTKVLRIVAHLGGISYLSGRSSRIRLSNSMAGVRLGGGKHVPHNKG